MVTFNLVAAWACEPFCEELHDWVEAVADNPLHLDHCFASPDLVKSFIIHARWQWLALSDHLPIEIETNQTNL